MLKNSFLKTIPFLLFVVLFYSCDKEINAVGSDLIGDNNFDIVKNEFSVVSYNQKLGPIQSNNLETNPFGVYDNPSFGTTNANFVTQLALVSVAPTFDLTTAKIKSVVLSIPYFFDKTKTVTNSDGSSTYVLDSIYGPEKAKMKLSVYESGYYMRDLDPDSQFSQAQKYYTNQFADFNQLKIGSPLNDASNTAENSEFFFDPSEHVVNTTTDGKTTTTRTAPAMQLNLNKDFFMSKVLKAPTAALASDAAFKEYFRGLFFNIETINGNPGDLAMINFKAGKITITYTETVNSVDTEKTFVLNLSGNTVSLLNQSNDNQNYINGITNVDIVKGDPNLYLKGGEGSMSVLKLFGDDKYGADGVSGAPNGVADQLDILRKNKYLINEADLTFNLNTDAMGNSYVAQRIYLYDFKNNQVLIDYPIDNSSASSNTKNNKFVFGGILVKKSAADGGGSSYKFRITNHIRNLVKHADSTNVDLGLVVTEDINKSSFYYLRDKTGFPLKAPMASVMNPLGTIIFGNNIAIDDKNYNKRLKFEIYYTKTN